MRCLTDGPPIGQVATGSAACVLRSLRLSVIGRCPQAPPATTSRTAGATLGDVTSEHPSPIGLVAIDEVVLEQLVQAAVSEASADEVTPPLSAGTEWTPARVAWLEKFHRDRRAGLSGEAAEATWAVVVGNAVVGAVRLKGTNEQGLLETGIWLTRSSRGRGVAVAAMEAVLGQAAALHAHGVRAETTTGNTSAQGVLRRLGFDLELTGGDCVRAMLLLAPDGAPAPAVGPQKPM